MDVARTVVSIMGLEDKETKDNSPKANLRKVIDTATQLFDKRQNLDIIVEFKDKGDFIVTGFEKDILRVINNILKNAVQATEGIEGIVNIIIKRDGSFIEIQIKDNGKGIADRAKSNIFQPYFL